jgi:hypothetical protein
MLGRCAVVVLVMQLAPGLSALAQDHLEPEEGLLAADELHWDYAKRIRDVLLKDSASDYLARMVCLPSFEPEWAVTVVREDGPRRDDSITYFVEYVVVEKQLWPPGNRAAQNARVRKFRAVLDSETAGSLNAIWGRMLRSVRFPDELQTGEDGENYHFSGFISPIAAGGGAFPGTSDRAEGKIWSPEEGSLCGEFVGIGVELKTYALAQEPLDREKLALKIRDMVNQLTAKLDRPGRR